MRMRQRRVYLPWSVVERMIGTCPQIQPFRRRKNRSNNHLSTMTKKKKKKKTWDPHHFPWIPKQHWMYSIAISAVKRDHLCRVTKRHSPTRCTGILTVPMDAKLVGKSKSNTAQPGWKDELSATIRTRTNIKFNSTTTTTRHVGYGSAANNTIYNWPHASSGPMSRVTRGGRHSSWNPMWKRPKPKMGMLVWNFLARAKFPVCAIVPTRSDRSIRVRSMPSSPDTRKNAINVPINSPYKNIKPFAERAKRRPSITREWHCTWPIFMPPLPCRRVVAAALPATLTRQSKISLDNGSRSIDRMSIIRTETLALVQCDSTVLFKKSGSCRLKFPNVRVNDPSIHRPGLIYCKKIFN